MLRKIFTACAAMTLLFMSDLRGQYILYKSSQEYWLDVEYLNWKINNPSKIIPLVVQGPPVPDGTPVLGLPGTQVLLGGSEIENKWRSGGKFTLGYMIDNPCRSVGIETNYFFLPKESDRQMVFSNGLIGSPFFTIPFFDVTTGLGSSVAIARPGDFAGKAVLKSYNYMQGAELNVFGMIPYSYNINIGALGGLRYWNFVEGLSFDTSSPLVPPGTIDIFQTHDSFDVYNNFIGGQIGLKLEYFINHFFLNLTGKLALGAMFQDSVISGYLVTNDFNGFGTSQTFSGGYFALPTNIGSHQHISLAVIPETDIKIGYQVTDRLSLQIGYTFLWASHVLFSTSQINPEINPTQSVAIESDPNTTLVGQGSPISRPSSQSLFVQGFSFGFEYSF